MNQKKYKTFVGTSVAGFLGVASFAAINPQDLIDSVLETLGQTVGQVWQYVVFQIQQLTGTLFDQVGKITEEIGNLLVVPFQVMADVISALGNGASNLVETLFGAGFVGDLTFAAEGPLGVPSIGYGILGMIVVGIGIGLMVGTDFPIVGEFGTGAGSVGVIVGAQIGVWGFFPDLSKFILGGVFAFMFLAVAITYIQVVRAETKGTTV